MFCLLLCGAKRGIIQIDLLDCKEIRKSICDRVRIYTMTVKVNKTPIRRIPQRHPTVCELLLYAVIPFLLAMAGVMPTTAIVILPFVFPLLYLLFRRFGIYMPLSCIVGYGIFSLSVNYDILTVVYFVTLFFAFCGLVLSQQTTPYLKRIAIAAIVAAAGMLIGVGIVRLAEGVPIGDIAARYVYSHKADPVVSFFARAYYDGAKLPVGTVKLTHGEAGYFTAALECFAEYVSDTLSVEFWYYCFHCGFLLATIGFVIADIVNRRTLGVYDMIEVGTAENADEIGDRLKNSTLALGGVRSEVRLSQMKMPRAFLWTMALPVTVAGVIIGLTTDLNMLTATFMHMFVTLPSAFSCFCLLAYFAELFKGKARIAAFVVLGLIGVVAVVFPLALLILSMFGVCDCILNIRFWTEFIRTD